ncbi:MAG: PspC domain-containing protein [Gemmatimonadaceae bacterium]|nr:PspC domain-containing protein [Chitinophagaceae bacterium]
MKKIININFQGRVIPIEETAYDTLKQYIDSLRRYFANEDGRDEIINDIESRIAELFSERIKRGSACITDEDVSAVMMSIGRPQDFDQESGEGAFGEQPASAGAASQEQQQQQHNYQYTTATGRMFRNQDDKIIAGVCSGLANSLRIDPAIMRVLFVLLFGMTFWIYIILWIVLPAQSVKTQITKRLYRNPEGKVIGGVCAGLASYFKTDIWIPRLIFALPLLVSILNGAFHGPWFDFDFFPGFLTGSITGTLFVVYVILWIVLPEANTASEKLEMRGEKIDINSIRDTVQGDLQGFKERAKDFGAELKETAEGLGARAKEFGQQAGERAKAFAAETAPAAKRASGGLGHIIGVLFKVFFFLIAGSIVIALLAGLVALFGLGVAMMPFKGYILDGGTQNLLAWLSLLFFVGIPIIAFIVWIIRRIAGIKTRNHYLGYTFGVLWIVGLFSIIMLGIAIKRNFDYTSPIDQTHTLVQPPTGKMVVKVTNSTTRYYGGWMGNMRGPFQLMDDSLVLKNLRLVINKSPDSLYHLSSVKVANGRTGPQSTDFAENIKYEINQQDSTLYLPNSFSIPAGSKFRNQRVQFTLQVPVGKRFYIDRSVHRFNWFHINFGSNNDWEWEDNRHNNFWWQENTEYIMTLGGIEKAEDIDKNGNKIRRDDDNDDRNDRDEEIYQYRYNQIEDSIKEKAKDKFREEMRIKDSIERENKVKEVIKAKAMMEKKKQDEMRRAYAYQDIVSPVMVFEKLIP